MTVRKPGPRRLRVRRAARGPDCLRRPGSLAIAVCLLEDDRLPFTTVEERLRISRNTMMYHVRHLQKSGIVEAHEKDGLTVVLVQPETVKEWMDLHHPGMLKNGKAGRKFWAWVARSFEANRRPGNPPARRRADS